MKVFISHSTQDKWAARRISSELNSLGTLTFLDEKDIKTGESIDIKIQENLSDCDDLLILISPASVNSQWVLIELGGAIALKKNIIPIFLYVGPNEIPGPINKLLGRDINEIEKYYSELDSRITGKEEKIIPKEKPLEIITKYKVGDLVKLPNNPPTDTKEFSTIPGWNPEMDKYLGLTSKILEIREKDSVIMALVEVDDREWFWALNWLVKIS